MMRSEQAHTVHAYRRGRPYAFLTSERRAGGCWRTSRGRRTSSAAQLFPLPIPARAGAMSTPNTQSTLFTPSRRAIALVCGLFLALFLLNAFLHGPPRSALHIPTPSLDFLAASPPTPHVQDTALRDEDAVVLALVAFGPPALDGIKSALLHASAALDLRIVCTADAIPLLQSVLSPLAPFVARALTRAKAKARPRAAPRAGRARVVLPADAGRRCRPRAPRGHRGRAALPSLYVRAAPHTSTSLTRPPSTADLARLFIHELVPEVPRALFLDAGAGAVFHADPLLLWRELQTEGKNATIVKYGKGAMALELDAMNDAPFMESTLRAETMTRRCVLCPCART